MEQQNCEGVVWHRLGLEYRGALGGGGAEELLFDRSIFQMFGATFNSHCSTLLGHKNALKRKMVVLNVDMFLDHLAVSEQLLM